MLPQYRGERCLSRYPLSACPFPGQCAPPLDELDMGLPCAVWGTGHLESYAQYGAGEGRGTTLRAGQPRDWDAPGRWVRDMWHPYNAGAARAEGRQQ